MKQIQIQTGTGQYGVFIGRGLRYKVNEFLTKDYSRVHIITDSNVKPLYLEDVIDTLKETQDVDYSVVPAGEESKSHHIYFDLLTEIIQKGLDRDSLIIALGGGMVGDLAGFVAATFMRGIDFLQMPTTILAHDSSVGGKVAINHPEGKNLVGSFYPPVSVIYDVETLHTLSLSEIRSGYAEVVKHSMIHKPDFWEELQPIDLTQPLDDKILMRDLLKGIDVKAKIVEEDERESNIRQYLNFGHTLGHALESVLGYGKITHGEAIAIGMLFAMRVSEILYKIKLPYDGLFEWLRDNDYPLQIPKLSVNKLIDRMRRDKKAKNQKITLVLLKELGEPTIEQVDDKRLNVWLNDFLQELNHH